jgi:hypothetical protein
MNQLPTIPELSTLQAKVSDLPLSKISESTTTVNTIVNVTQIHVEQRVNVEMDMDRDMKVEEGLSERGKEVLDQLYETAKKAVKEILSLDSLDHAMKIGRMIAEIVKLMEKATYRGSKIPGEEKKEIALELGKRLLMDPSVVSNETVRNGLLTAYDLVGEQMLDTLIDVSRHVNTAIKEVAISCCESLLRMIKK